MKYLILLIFLSSCANFNTIVEKSEITKEPKNQLNCEPAESDGCAGWLPLDETVVKD